jgi:molybdopterin converting factor small subunit
MTSEAACRDTTWFKVTVKVHSTLREVVGKPDLVVKVADNSSVRDVLDKFVNQFKNGFHLKYNFGDGEGDLQKYFIISLNGTLLSNTGLSEMKVKEGDTVDILEIIAGG